MKELVKTIPAYLVGIALLTFYGGQVCPFLEKLSLPELARILAVAFFLGVLIRSVILHRLHQKEQANPQERDINRPWRYLLVELGVWVAVGLLVTGWNVAMYDFPVVSGLKVVLGCTTLGIFTATSLALDVEKDMIRSHAKERGLTGGTSGKFFSITTKFFVFVGMSFVVITGVILLLVYKDFQFTIQKLSHDEPFQFTWVVQEILFVFAILLGGVFIATKKYSRNLKLMFDLQLRALHSVEQGNYDTFVPVVSHDEFSVIAQQTNTMIAGLREKERIKRAFGKYMSPAVAEEILSHEQGTKLGGRQTNAAILFTDIRDFTPLAEKCTPQEIVSLLNDYFTMIVKAVYRHQGVLDKFVGDAAMAVFGLDRMENPSEAAVSTAIDIREALVTFNQGLAGRGLPLIENGIGVHYGQVVAGNIGSEERLEYTVIGDTVNTASRLEGLTKVIPSPIAVSESVYNRVEPETRSRLRYIGDYELKGKSAAFPVYGLVIG